MKIAVIGTGFIGSILGRSLAKAGQDVVFGSRHPDEETRASGTSAKIASIGDALAGADVVILAVPGVAVAELSSAHGDALAGKVAIDAPNQMGQPIANSRGALPTNIRYVRAFNTLGGENLIDPQFADGPADMFFSGPEADRGLARSYDASAEYPLRRGDHRRSGLGRRVGYHWRVGHSVWRSSLLVCGHLSA